MWFWFALGSAVFQYIAAPYATFVPVENNNDFTWKTGAVSSYRFRLFGIVPFGVHTIRMRAAS